MRASKSEIHFTFCNLNSAFKRADRLFGEETFYAKVDTTLPERKMKAWEKKTSNGDDE